MPQVEAKPENQPEPTKLLPNESERKLQVDGFNVRIAAKGLKPEHDALLAKPIDAVMAILKENGVEPFKGAELMVTRSQVANGLRLAFHDAQGDLISAPLKLSQKASNDLGWHVDPAEQVPDEKTPPAKPAPRKSR